MSATDDTPSAWRESAPRGPTPRATNAGGARTSADAGTAYQQVQRTPEFAALRKRWRGFIFTMSAVFLIWFLAYVVLAGFFVEIVNTPALGNITWGFVLGLLQFVSTFVIATMYVSFANKNLDPEAERLRLQVEEKL